MTTATANKTILRKDYEVNYGGTTMEIKPYMKGMFYILFELGSGWGDQSYWSESTAIYGIYKLTDIVGDTLERVGTVNEYVSTDRSHFTAVFVDGKIFEMDASATNVFTTIYPKSSATIIEETK